MKNKILIGCDLHNTLLLSNDAWISAFMTLDSTIDEKRISKEIYNKKSRKELANLYGINYDDLLNMYHNLCLINEKLVLFIKSLQEKEFQIVLISSSNKEKVNNDLKSISKYIVFDEIYTKEKFKKNNKNDWDKLLEKYNADFLVYFGNDYDEDIIHHDKVISILSGHFFTELKNIGILNERGSNV